MATPEISSRIEAVTVYRRGARVVRAAELVAEEGRFPAAVAVAGLPLAAVDASFRVRVEAAGGDSGALPIARDLRIALAAPQTERRAPTADQAELDQAVLDEARLRKRLEQLDQERERVVELSALERPTGREGEPPPAVPLATRLALLDFASSRAEALDGEKVELDEKLSRARRRREELEDRARRASTAEQPEAHALRKTAIVSLAGPGEGSSAARARVVVEYQVPGARWAPLYALRLPAEGGRAELTLRGLVAQNTGEDWKDVRLELSTADAARHVDLPELRSVRIGRRQPAAPPRGWRAPPEGAESLYTDWDRAFGARRDSLPRPAPPPALIASAAEPVALDDELLELSADLSTAAAEADEAVFGAPMAGAAPPPAASAPALTARSARPAASALGSLRRRKSARRTGPRPGAAPPVVEPPELRARDDQLEYASLRMPPPEESGRGHLVVLSRTRLYLELQVEQEAVITALLSDAQQRAEAAGGALPRHVRPVDEVDGFDAAWQTDAQVDVPSDEGCHSVPLLSREADVELRHVAVPRESQEVFEIVALRNPLGGSLLPGPVDVYSGGAFRLTAQLPATPSDAAVELGLGADSAVRVSRNARYSEDTKGLTGGRLQLDHAVEIEVRNNRSRAIRVEVRERVPVAPEKHPDLQVEVGEVDPPWEPWTPESQAGVSRLLGGHRWRFEVAPGATAALRAAYRVRISSKHEVVGGNRREP